MTINCKEDQWDGVRKWMWENRECYNGISLFPYDSGSFTQAPFETITKEEYNLRVGKIKELDLTKVIEIDDNTTQVQELACSGDNCEVK